MKQFFKAIVGPGGGPPEERGRGMTRACFPSELLDKILEGDSMELVKALPDNCVNCVVTSPPYWGLRDYGVAGQLGLEESLEDYTAKIVDLFLEVFRVLTPDGTMWLNMGDKYAKTGTPGGWDPTMGYRNKNVKYPKGRIPGGLKEKDLVGLPWRLAFALQGHGWFLRSDIIWSKPNPMPESVKDRPTRAHEYIFLMTKSAQYWYDADAIREPMKEDTIPRYLRGRSDNHKNADGAPGNQTIAKRMPTPTGWDTGKGCHGNIHKDGRTKDKQRGHGRRHAGFNDRWDDMTREEQRANGANKRDVWNVATRGFSEAHFATFPPDLIEPCILAGCPKGGVVLDPFMGSGTVGVVAHENNRHFIGFELNPEYIEIARRRLSQAERVLA